MKIETITDNKKIKEIEPKLQELRDLSLYPTKFDLNEIEIKKFNEFKKINGPGICSATRYSTGECFTFSFTPGGLGIIKEVECDCGEKINITDFKDI